MQKIYKILNPATGEYEPAATLEECLDKVSTRAVEFYKHHTHNNPYSVVEVHDNGTEIWRNPDGNEILCPVKLEENIKKLLLNS